MLPHLERNFINSCSALTQNVPKLVPKRRQSETSTDCFTAHPPFNSKRSGLASGHHPHTIQKDLASHVDSMDSMRNIATCLGRAIYVVDVQTSDGLQQTIAMAS